MTIEEKLKEYILEKYGSIRAFAMQSGLIYTNIDSILRRGIKNATWTNVKTVCNALQLDVDALADGKIAPALRNAEQEEIGVNALVTALQDTDKPFTIDGTPLTASERMILLTGLETTLAIIRASRKA